MIIGFLPPSNWKGANLVTHELHRRKKKCSLEMKLQCVFRTPHLASIVEGQSHTEQSPLSWQSRWRELLSLPTPEVVQ